MALVECSNHYALSMSRVSLLPMSTGVQFDPTNGGF